ncbi:MAG: response regulator, partial [Syntrophales bacterium]|nr:response regulator [Syntrophales bacterium]
MDEPLRILIAEDMPTDAELAQREIGKHIAGCAYRVVDNEEDFLNALEVFQPDVVITDYVMPRFDGMRALTIVQERYPDT